MITIATTLAVQKHLDAALEATGLLVQALYAEAPYQSDHHQAQQAYEYLANIRRRRSSVNDHLHPSG